MPYEILEHTGDLQMKITAKTREDLFSEALRGMMSFLKKVPGASGHRIKRTVSISSVDLTALLVDFLSEALALSQIHKEVYDKVTFKKFSRNSLEAELEGSLVKSFDEDIKAVTHHEAEVKESGKGQWSTNLIFDI